MTCQSGALPRSRKPGEISRNKRNRRGRGANTLTGILHEGKSGDLTCQKAGAWRKRRSDESVEAPVAFDSGL